MIFFGHSATGLDESDWQRLSEHLQQVAALAGQFAAAFGAAELGHCAGLLHDLGKYTDAFQRRLRGSAEKVDHSTWGARVALARYPSLGYLLAYGIAGHHAGLANGNGEGRRTSLQERLNAVLPALAICRPWRDGSAQAVCL